MKIKNIAKKTIAIICMISLIGGGYLVGTIQEKTTVYAGTIVAEANYTGDSVIPIDINTSGYYYVSLCGSMGKGGTNTYYWEAGHGSELKALVYLSKDSKIELISYAGGAGGQQNGNGGDAIGLYINEELIAGAGGGGGVTTHYSSKESSYVNGLSVIGCTNGFGSGAGGALQANFGIDGLAGSSGARPTTRYSGGIQAEAGGNYINEDKAMLVSEKDYANTVGRYAIEYAGANNLPVDAGTAVQGDTDAVFTAIIDETYQVMLQTIGGDIATGNIKIKKGEIIDVSISNAGDIVLRVDGETQIVAAKPGGVIITTDPMYKLTGWISSGTYFNTSRVTNPIKDSETKAEYLNWTISCKQADQIDTYDYQKRQAIAQEQLVAEVRQLKDKVGTTDEIISDKLVVVAGKAFGEFIGISNDTTVGGTSEGITIINSNSKDGMVKISGIIDLEGEYQYTIDNVIYTIKVVNEPSSSNIEAVF